MKSYVIHIQMDKGPKEVHTDDIERWMERLDRENACYQVHVIGNAPVPKIRVRRYEPC